MSPHATVHPGASITPTKIELARQWLPKQVWFMGEAQDAELLNRFRFVDPEGEVGVETLLVGVGQDIYQVPLTYRAAPLEGGEESLVGTTEHSVLGTRYVYDGMGDPVFLAELERTIRERDTAASVLNADGTVRPPTVAVRGSGVVEGVDVQGELEVVGLITDDPYQDAAGWLYAVVGDHDEAREVVLAVLR